jgi:Na+/H+ antiporter NhaD/arsenite permease-like protein
MPLFCPFLVFFLIILPLCFATFSSFSTFCSHLLPHYLASLCVLLALADNVTTILLVVPVTIQLCQVIEVDPMQIIVSLVLFR